MKKMITFGFISILFAMTPHLLPASQTKGIEIVVKDASGRKVGLYNPSLPLKQDKLLY